MTTVKLVHVPSEIANIPDELKVAYKEYALALDEVPDIEFTKGFKYRQKKANKCYRNFSDLCKTHGLDPIDTANQLFGTVKSTR